MPSRVARKDAVAKLDWTDQTRPTAILPGVDGPDQLVEEIRRSVAVTAAAGTARIRFMPSRIVGRSFETVLAERSSARTVAVFGLARRVVKRGLAVIPPSSTESGFAAGQIDFAQRRSVYNAGTFWKLFAPGHDFVGRPGAWEADGHEGIAFEEPFWLLELIGSTVEAVEDETEFVRGERCRRHRCAADFTRAAAGAPAGGLARPVWLDRLDPGRLAVDVWLDDDGRIRRARFHEAGSLTTLELFDFGEPRPIELPGAAEILPEDE
jgi:hypothetical protein